MEKDEGKAAMIHRSKVAPCVLIHKSGMLPKSMHTAPRTGFDYPVVKRGNTQHFTVYYDPSLGDANGQALADGVLATCEAEYSRLAAIFLVNVPSFNIIIAPLDPQGQGRGGAYHYGCPATDLYCDAKTSPNLDVDYTRMMVVAEEVEVFEAIQNKGWDCGGSNGEGLSRILATLLYPVELDGYASADVWLESNRDNWVDNNDNTDMNYLSIGCSTLFLNWLNLQLGYDWPSIVQAAGPTLAQTYATLTGQNDGWNKFKTLIDITTFPDPLPDGTDNPANWPKPNTIKGMITDSEKGTPINGASVVVTDANNSVVAFASTDSTGFYSIIIKHIDIPPGICKINAVAQGYENSDDVTITVNYGIPITQDFKLEKIVWGTVKGNVSDADTGNPIWDAKISSGHNWAKSDSEGNYAFSLPSTISGRTKTIRVSADNYESPRQKDVTVFGGQTVIVNFTLREVFCPVARTPT